MINFGLPYMGSKSKVAAELIRLIPSGERFVDVFAGGCAMTHAAMLVGRWKTYFANDIAGGPELFKDAMDGKFRNEKRWISREEFFALNDKDPYVRFCFSFGNNGRTYIYSEEIEPYKKACHYAVVFDDWKLFQTLCPEVTLAARKALVGKADTTQRRLALGPAVVKALKALKNPELIARNPLYNSCHRKIVFGTNPDATYLERLESLQSLQSLESLERLQSLERLERLQSLERLERLNCIGRVPGNLEARRGDYRGIVVKPGDILYCDPPYKGTQGYNGMEFDHEAFYAWVEAQTVPVYISEYWMPEDRFMCVKSIKTQSRLSSKGTNGVVYEKLFVKRPKRK